MMHRPKKLLGSGDQGYCNEKRPVNVRVDGTAHFAELFARSAATRSRLGIACGYRRV